LRGVVFGRVRTVVGTSLTRFKGLAGRRDPVKRSGGASANTGRIGAAGGTTC